MYGGYGFTGGDARAYAWVYTRDSHPSKGAWRSGKGGEKPDPPVLLKEGEGEGVNEGISQREEEKGKPRFR